MAEKTFDNLEPPTRVTNPDGPSAGAPFPRHVHFEDGSYVVVNSDEELQAKLEEGYTLDPQCNLDGSPFAKDVQAKKIEAQKSKSKSKS